MSKTQSTDYLGMFMNSIKNAQKELEALPVRFAVGEGDVDDLQDPLTSKTLDKLAPTTPAATKALKIENGTFLEQQANGSWKKLDWFP